MSARLSLYHKVIESRSKIKMWENFNTLNWRLLIKFLQFLRQAVKAFLTVFCLFHVVQAETSLPTETVKMGVYFFGSYKFPSLNDAFVQNLNVTSESQVLEVVDITGSGVSNDNVGEISFTNSETTFVITQFFATFPNLKSLQMKQGKLQRIQPGAFKNAGNLEIIDFMNNALRFIGPNSFLGAEKLTQLGLWSNQIEWIDANAFNGLPNLQKLAMNANKLRTLPATLYSPLPKLSYISLSDNELSSIPSKLFFKNPLLETITLGYNNIKAISPNFLDNLTALKNLDLHSNDCIGTDYDGSWFTDLQSPEWVQLISNALVPCFNSFVEVPEHCPAL